MRSVGRKGPVEKVHRYLQRYTADRIPEGILITTPPTWTYHHEWAWSGCEQNLFTEKVKWILGHFGNLF